MSNPTRIICTPADAVAERILETVIVERRTFILERPSGIELVFNHPIVLSTYATHEYIPYWTDLWAAGRMLAKVVLRESWEQWPAPVQALEIGCGLGLGGIAALARGLHVTFSDIDEMAVRFATANAARNGFTQFAALPLDMRSPPEGVTFPVIIGSDLMYIEAMVEPLAAFIKATLAPGGLALITDPDRECARSFRWRCGEAELDVEPSFIRAGEPGGERTKGTLYRIRHMS